MLNANVGRSNYSRRTPGWRRYTKKFPQPDPKVRQEVLDKNRSISVKDNDWSIAKPAPTRAWSDDAIVEPLEWPEALPRPDFNHVPSSSLGNADIPEKFRGSKVQKEVLVWRSANKPSGGDLGSAPAAPMNKVVPPS